MKTPHEVKERVVAKAKELMAEKFPMALEPDMPGACLYWAACTLTAMVLLKTHKPMVQAGSCFWPRLREDQDDGEPTTLTHFGYKWDVSNPLNNLMIVAGKLPEIHIWVGLKEENELVDLSTCGLVEQCRRNIGQDWPGDKPPDWFWATCDEMPDRVRYDADIHACLLAHDLVEVNPGVALRNYWSKAK